MKRLLSYLNTFHKSVWLFPVIVLLGCAILVSFGISGSSVGIYNDFLNNSAKDKNLLFGHPREIRSDEWWVTAPLVVSQSHNGYANVNMAIGDGQDMNVISDIPTHNWVQIFRIQNWGFGFLPLDNAYSLRWWALPVLLVISAYFFALTLLPKRRLLASLLSLRLFLSPFFHWWSLGGTTGIVAHSLLMLVAFTYFLRARRMRYRLLFSLLFSFSAICFALYAYPPFQIPCMVVVIAYIIGLLLRSGFKDFLSTLKTIWPYCLGVLAVVAAVVALFLMQNNATVKAISETAYPGKRVIPSGGYTLKHFMFGPLSYKLESNKQASHYRDISSGAVNQSESATFIYSAFFLLPIIAYIAIKYRRLKMIRPDLLLIVCVALAVGVLLAWMFVPDLDLFGRISKFDTIPIGRVVIGLGLANFMLLCLFVKLYAEKSLSVRRLFIAIVCLAYAALCIYEFHNISVANPGFLTRTQIIATSFVIPITVYLLATKKFVIGISAIVLYGIFCVGYINPLYRGMGPLVDNNIYRSVQTSSWQGKWAIENPILKGVLTATNKPAVTGVYFYPQFSVWDSFNDSYKNIYNRYAHVTISIDKDPSVSVPQALVLLAPDSFTIQTEACSTFMKSEDVTNIITTVQLPDEGNNCIIDKKQILIGTTRYYLYHLNN